MKETIVKTPEFQNIRKPHSTSNHENLSNMAMEEPSSIENI
jgi:hypothetical protein